jgi:hypothetical protein
VPRSLWVSAATSVLSILRNWGSGEMHNSDVTLLLRVAGRLSDAVVHASVAWSSKGSSWILNLKEEEIMTELYSPAHGPAIGVAPVTRTRAVVVVFIIEDALKAGIG